MRIGLIAPPWLPVPPPGYGGTEMVIDLLARGLRERGHTVTLFTTGDSQCPVSIGWEFPAALSTRSGDDHRAHVRHLDAAYRHLSQVGVDIIHDHTALGPALHRPSVPVVATMHGVMDEPTRQLCADYPEEVAIVAISASQSGSAPEIPFAAVIHHGIDVDTIPFGAGSGGNLLFLGRMSPAKGVRTAIEIARNAELPLTIAAKAAEDDERSYFVHEIEPLLGGGVTFVGEADPVRKQELLGSARGLLNPIKWREPFGLVMIESLAAGTPVIASPQGSAPEIIDVGVTGFLCGTLADAVAACHRLDTLSRTECRTAASARFDADRMIAQHEALYRDIVERRRRSADLPEPRDRRSSARGLFARRDTCPDCGTLLQFSVTQTAVTLHCPGCAQDWGKDLGALHRIAESPAPAASPTVRGWGTVRRPRVTRNADDSMARL